MAGASRSLFGGEWVKLAMLLAAFLWVVAIPASAHKDHERKPVPAAASSSSVPAANPAAPATMGHVMAQAPERRSEAVGIRLVDWLGRLHPIVVHFPLAFLPVAFLTAIVGRKRPAFVQPVQFLVVAGGLTAPLAAAVGWLDAGVVADDDWLLGVHRWLGSAIGVGAFGLAVWAIKRPMQDRSTGMILALGLVTIAIVVQGWFGGALVHGPDHMNW